MIGSDKIGNFSVIADTMAPDENTLLRKPHSSRAKSTSESDEIKKYAVSQGMRTLREEALEKFTSGLTTLEEVLRVTTEE